MTCWSRVCGRSTGTYSVRVTASVSGCTAIGCLSKLKRFKQYVHLSSDTREKYSRLSFSWLVVNLRRRRIVIPLAVEMLPIGGQVSCQS